MKKLNSYTKEIYNLYNKGANQKIFIMIMNQ